MKYLYAYLVFVLVAAYVVFDRNDKSLKQAKSELVKDRAVLDKHQAMLAEMQKNPVNPPDAEEMHRLEQDRRDLIRLRGEYTRFTSTKGKSIEGLEREIAATKAKAEAVWSESGLISKMEKAKDERKAERSMIQTLYHLLAYYEKQNQRPPESIEIAVDWIESLPGKTVEKTILENISVRNEFRHMTWEDCELYDTGRRTPAGDSLKLLREKSPRCMPDDSVSRFYILETGRFREVAAPSSEFREQEAAFLSDLAN